MIEIKKKAWLAVAIVLIVGAIVYLENLQAHPGGGSGVPVQTIAGTGTGVSTSSDAAIQALAAADKAVGYAPAIELTDPTGFVNASSSFRLKDLVGKKVVLLDFWTYSCINCIRTLPFLTAWDQKYKDKGLVIVGVHTPEFDFEKNYANVATAVKNFGIHYPVVLDSNYGTWSAYNNLYWPHEYLIDLAGYIVHDHIGEGGYDETEALIQKLLGERGTALGAGAPQSTPMLDMKPSDLTGIGSPETYFGAARNTYLANGTRGIAGMQELIEPQAVQLNSLYLAGSWNFTQEYAETVKGGAKIIFKYRSNKVYFVASAKPGVAVRVLQDGKPLSAAAAGSDVKNGAFTVTASRLYDVVNNPDGSKEHTLELDIDAPGLQAFTFTFG